MKKANRTRIVENSLSEHIRQENAAYREIERKRQTSEREAGTRDPQPPAAGPDLVCWEYQADREPIRLSYSIKVF